LQGLEGVGNHSHQRRLAFQRLGECRLALAGRILEQRAQFALDPVRVEVEHRIGEATGCRRVAVVQLAGFEQKHLPWCAAVQRPAAVKLLNALFGEADQVAVMEVRVVGMTLEVRTDRLDTGLGILLQIDPVSCTHDGSVKRKAAMLRDTVSPRERGRSGTFVQRCGLAAAPRASASSRGH